MNSVRNFSKSAPNGVNFYELIIIGSGPAGLTAAIYAARAELHPLLLAGSTYGGQLMLTTEVGNYPGFVEDILGPELIDRMLKQAQRFGTEVVFEDVTRVDFSSRPFKIWPHDKAYQTRAVIIATGAKAKWLGLPSEQKLIGRGVSSCAPCDAYFFRNKKVIVVGGGDAAMEEALVLTKFATAVTVIHRRDSLRASKIMQRRAMENPKIQFIWDTAVIEVLGEEQVAGVRLKNLKTAREIEMPIEGVFVAIGHEPNTKFLAGSGIELDEKGYVKIKNDSRTNLEAVFVAGDIHDHVYRQVVTAAGAGCKAAMEAEKYLAEKEAVKRR